MSVLFCQLFQTSKRLKKPSCKLRIDCYYCYHIGVVNVAQTFFVVSNDCTKNLVYKSDTCFKSKVLFVFQLKFSA